ncbi:MAG: hypothetical protein JSR72_18545 [Proteobacteria bacterium]|nr:hypothetical protein [Pseudomonadota bacterium]
MALARGEIADSMVRDIAELCGDFAHTLPWFLLHVVGQWRALDTVTGETPAATATLCMVIDPIFRAVLTTAFQPFPEWIGHENPCFQVPPDSQSQSLDLMRAVMVG